MRLALSNSLTDSGSVAARETLVRKVLLRKKATRSDLRRETGLCAASVTNHTRWLLRHGFLTSTPIRVPDVKRSVEQLGVNAAQGTALAILVRDELIDTQVLGLDAQVLAQFNASVAEPTQKGVFLAISSAVEEAKHWARTQGRLIDLGGMSVCGTVASEDGIVFGIDGIPEWSPCQPLLMLPALKRQVPVLHVWTQVMSKLIGLSSQEQRDDRIGYAEFFGRHSFHISSMRKGEVCLGRHGTTSSLLHESVSDDGSVCYCGRRGCLADLLESGRLADLRVLADAFVKFLQRIEVDTLGLEWQGEEKDWLESQLRKSAFKVCPIANGRDIALRGLRILTAQSLLVRKLAYYGETSGAQAHGI